MYSAAFDVRLSCASSTAVLVDRTARNFLFRPTGTSSHEVQLLDHYPQVVNLVERGLKPVADLHPRTAVHTHFRNGQP